MKNSPGLLKNSFKENKMEFRGWYTLGLNKDLIFFCMCIKHPIAFFITEVVL